MTDTLAAILGAVALCAALGALVDRALFAAGPRGVAERAGRALLLGFLVTGCVSLALDTLGAGVSRATLGLGLLAIAAPCGLVLRRRRASRVPAPCPPPREPLAGGALWAQRGLLAFAALSLLLPLTAGLVLPPFQFDSLTRWLLKSKALAFEGTLDGPLSSDSAFAWTHQRYPALLPHVANVPAVLSGRWDERAAEGVYPWFAVALVLVAYGALARRADPLRAALGAAWVASLPLVSFLPRPPPGSGAFSAMADVPLAAFAAAAGLALVDALDEVRDRAHIEAALLLAGAALTKNEGLPLLAGAALALLLGARRARWRRAAGVAGLAAGLYLLLWWSLAQRFPALDENYAGRLHGEALAQGWGRLRFLLPAFATEVVSFQRWGLTWLAAAALLVLGRPRRPVRALLALVGLQFASYLLAFVVSAWTSPSAEILAPSGGAVEYLLNLTLGRLFLHLAPLVVVLSLLASPTLHARTAPTGG